MKQIQRQQWMTKVIEHSHEQDDVEFLPQRRDIVNIELLELNVHSARLGGKTGLLQISEIGIDANNPGGAPLLHLYGVEASVAANIKNGLAAQVARNALLKHSPLNRRIVAQKMIRSRLHA